MTRFSRAVVRSPAPNFADGLSTANLGLPAFELALEQHARYCQALERCGLSVMTLPPDDRHPDSTFVEDTAILAGQRAILTNPGAPSRQGEVGAIQETISLFFSGIDRITSPGTLDGGDVCEAGERFLIGVSDRTNEEGACQLAFLLQKSGFTTDLIDIRGIPGILHLKSDIASLGDGRLVTTQRLADHASLYGLERVIVPAGEEYAANLVRINDTVLVADGFPGIRNVLQQLGYCLLPLPMSEFRKMDGGLSCLSLRF